MKESGLKGGLYLDWGAHQRQIFFLKTLGYECVTSSLERTNRDKKGYPL
jgi:hypothetical protein